MKDYEKVRVTLIDMLKDLEQSLEEISQSAKPIDKKHNNEQLKSSLDNNNYTQPITKRNQND